MPTSDFSCHPKLSDTDRLAFGFPVARAYLNSLPDLRATLDFSHSHGVKLLVARVPTDEISLVQGLLSDDFLLTETQIYLTINLKKLGPASPIPVREALPEELPYLRELTARTFSGSHSHYHADPRLERGACDQLYADWVERTFCDVGPRTKIGVVEDRSRIVGFGIVRQVTEKKWEAVLGGAVPDTGLNPAFVYRAIVLAGLGFARANGGIRCETATQIANRMVLTTLARLGWEPGRSFYTFHKWFR